MGSCMKLNKLLPIRFLLKSSCVNAIRRLIGECDEIYLPNL
jgi:hypothetical protein